ncbi:unnamed protein product, partial [Protopolystoma xenopodis]
VNCPSESSYFLADHPHIPRITDPIIEVADESLAITSNTQRFSGYTPTHCSASPPATAANTSNICPGKSDISKWGAGKRPKSREVGASDGNDMKEDDATSALSSSYPSEQIFDDYSDASRSQMNHDGHNFLLTVPFAPGSLESLAPIIPAPSPLSPLFYTNKAGLEDPKQDNYESTPQTKLWDLPGHKETSMTGEALKASKMIQFPNDNF